MVYTNGYENGRDAVTMVVISSNKIVVKTAYNGHDETDNRLYLSQILMALWSNAGKSKSALRYLAWENVNNDPVTDALEGARDFLNLGENDDFILDVSSANKDIWETFELTAFGRVATRICRETRKSVKKIHVDNNRGAETVTWEMR